MNEIRPYRVEIAENAIVDLKERLARTRWPDRQPTDDWSQGVPLESIVSLCRYWGSDYDWRRCEDSINVIPNFITEIDGVDIHFLHVRSSRPDALPLIITHGWPGSILEFMKIIGPLTEPERHGGSAADAFHLVIPSLPGYGFSGKPASIGWGMERIARAWGMLMSRLGYDRFVAQGGDWGAGITARMGAAALEGLAAIHVTLPPVLPGILPADPTPDERRMLDDLQHYARWEAGYSTQQMTRPQTLSYSLADSPAGQAAWIYEKFRQWTDCGGDPESVVSRDELLDNISIYWFTNSAASSARLYWESFYGGFDALDIDTPVGCSIFAKEIVRPPRSWAEKCMKRIIYWNEVAAGGHFAALERPGLFIDEIRGCFRLVR